MLVQKIICDAGSAFLKNFTYAFYQGYCFQAQVQVTKSNPTFLWDDSVVSDNFLDQHRNHWDHLDFVDLLLQASSRFFATYTTCTWISDPEFGVRGCWKSMPKLPLVDRKLVCEDIEKVFWQFRVEKEYNPSTNQGSREIPSDRVHIRGISSECSPP